jgi:hypothetical protein
MKNLGLFLWPFGICYCRLVNFIVIWYFCGRLVSFPLFGILHQEKSGTPGIYTKSITSTNSNGPTQGLSFA